MRPLTDDDGWLRTGDGARLTDGFLVLADRLKDVIKTGGEWVSSLELDSLSSQHPAVNEVAVIGVKDEKWGERPLALVVLKADHKATVEDIQAVVMRSAEAGHISKYAVPDKVKFVDNLARTSVGKLNKKAMREQIDG